MSTSSPVPHFKSDTTNSDWSEYRVISVLFVDLVASVALLDRLGAERYQFTLRQFRNLLTRTIRNHNGTVEQYLGDGAMCFFRQGAHGEAGGIRAAYAALELQRALEQANLSDIKVRIGIATGRVLISGETDEPVVGSCLNLAARLQDLAEPDTILLCSETKATCEEQFLFTSAGRHDLKGFADPVSVWGLRKARIMRNIHRWGVSDKQHFMGRSGEMKRLLAAVDRAKQGQGSALTISGDAGLGKSRLVHEFLNSQALEDCSIISIQCVREQMGTNFHPFTAYFQWVSGVSANDTDQIRHDKVAQLLDRVWGLEETDNNRFLFVVGLAASLQVEEQPVLLRDWFFSILAGRLLEARAGQTALVFVVEDVHWMDPSSIEFFNKLVTEITGKPVMIVFTQRGKSHDDAVFFGPLVSYLGIEPLSKSEARKLATHFAGDKALADNTLDWICQKSKGYPLFIQAYSEMVATQDHITNFDQEVPNDLLGVIEERVGKLPDTVRRFIQIASVVGRQFDAELVDMMMEPQDELPDDYLEVLLSNHLIELPESDHVLVFSHELFRDAIYFNLGTSLRHRLHAGLVELLKARSESQSVRPQTLAYHYEKSEQFPEAVLALLAAAGEAAQSGAIQEAVSHVGHAIELLPQISAPIQRAKLELELRSLEAPLQMVMGGPGNPDFGRALDRSIMLLNTLEETSEAVHTHYNAGLHRWAVADLDQSLKIAQSIVKSHEAEPADAKLLSGNTLIGLINWHQGDNLTARSHLKIVTDAYDADKHRDLYPLFMKDFGVFANFYTALTASVMADHNTAKKYAVRSQELAAELGFPHETGFSNLAGLWTALFRGDVEETLIFSHRTIQNADMFKFPEFNAMGVFAQGWVEAQLSATMNTGLEKMEKGLEMWADTQFNCWQGIMASILADGIVAARRFEQALALVDRHLERIDGSGELQCFAPLQLVRAKALSEIFDTSAGQACYDEATGFAQKNGAALWAEFFKT